MKRFFTGILVVAAFLSFAFAAGGCTPGSSARQQRLAETVEKFHSLARTDPTSALSRYQTPQCAEKFAPTYKAFKDNWVSVLRPTTYESTFIGPDDARYTLEYDDHFVIEPMFNFWRDARDNGGRRLEYGFTYSSNSNDNWLSAEDILAMAKGSTVESA